MLGVVLVKYEKYFGLPIHTLYFLALIPILFILYDMYAFYRDENRTSLLMKGIAVMNTMYCILSIGFAIFHSSLLTNLGWTYVIGEVLIILMVAFFEWKTASNL